MENEPKKGKQKIEMQLIKYERARVISFSKRKKTLFQDAEKLATRSGDEVGAMLFSPIGKPFSYGSTSIEEIIDKFLKVKLEHVIMLRENLLDLRHLKIFAKNCKNLTRKKEDEY
ncbi:hypothetical protein MTR67_025977 [Solanum verrucosum]|uniref:MADS-box domain-containing protein n=1 Tax=Solanum verrucosum TaxID=315347 RepID=A0AAF0QY35_SOLVR|nr:hypothetical protein MTR67_025977 [Solanum verrucosum]